MPRTRRPKPLYQRGAFRLDRRPERDQLVITYYDPVKRRERGISAGTGDVEAAKAVVDRKYLESQGVTTCPTCGQATRGGHSPLVTSAIADYKVMRSDHASQNAIRIRLDHVLDYLEHTGAIDTTCASIDEAWIGRFRKWMTDKPIVSPTGKERQRAISTVENSVLQLAAVIRFADPTRSPKFKVLQPKDVNRTPVYRADTKTLAAMFAYALESPVKRKSLLHFLRLSVLTLGRPDAVLEASTRPDKGQWDARHGVFNLNPKGRRQTPKHRASVPIARQGLAWLNSLPHDEPIVKANSIKTAWNGMAKAIGLPGDGESGPKLIRRSVAELMRAHLLVAQWPEIEVFLGHDRFSAVSGLYAPLRPDYLMNAKAAIEAVIDEVEKLTPGAFYRIVTADEAPEGVSKVA